MSDIDTTEELCHCGKPLHYTDEVVEAFTKDLIRTAGPTVKVNVGNRTWEVQRHYIALHGVRAAELPDLGFPEVEVPQDSPAFQEGLGLSPDGAIEPPPGPLEGAQSDEALLAYQDDLERSSTRVGALDDLGAGPPRGSPMRSVMDSGAAKLADALQKAKEARGDQHVAIRGEAVDAYYDLLVAMAEFMLGN